MRRIKITNENVGILNDGDRVEVKMFGELYEGKISKTGKCCRLDPWYVVLSNGRLSQHASNFYKIVEKENTIRDIQVGDSLRDAAGDFVKVLAILGEVVFISRSGSTRLSGDLKEAGTYYTFHELEYLGYKVYEPECTTIGNLVSPLSYMWATLPDPRVTWYIDTSDETTELSIKEIEEKIGIKPGMLRVKKEAE